MRTQNHITSRHLRQVFWRSFLIQSYWNYRTMLAVGFGLCMIPILKVIYRESSAREAFLKRHFEFFNAHPYLTGYALGVSVRMEEEVSKGDERAAAQLKKYKELLCGTLGSLGDQVFWLTVRPAMLVAAVCGIYFLETMVFRVLVLVLVFLAYNIPHIMIRFNGIKQGYSNGIEVYKSVNSHKFKKLAGSYFVVGLVLFLLFLIGFSVKIMQGNYTHIIVPIISGVTAVLVHYKSNYLLVSVGVGILAGVIFGVLFL